MADKLRKKTKTNCVYLNTKTKKYDVKYNFKVYNPETNKNDYKAEWITGLETIEAAKKALAARRTEARKKEDTDITLEGAYKLWEIEAKAIPYSPVTISNTRQHCGMIYQFLPKTTKIKDITENTYYKLASECREHGYSEETLKSLNATFRKLINLCYRKKLVNENILNHSKNIKTGNKDDYRLIPKEDFDLIDNYLKNNKFVRLGVNNYPLHRLLFNILYYTGARIGEVLALTYNDFEEFSYYSRSEDDGRRLVPSSSKDTKAKHLKGLRVKITKAYVSDFKLTKDTKNVKHRTIPLAPAVERLYYRARETHKQSGGDMTDKIFNWGHGASDQMLKKACRVQNIPAYHCHEFRHTFISTLINKGVPLPVIERVSGDTQATIIERYSHLFEADEVMILNAMNDI